MALIIISLLDVTASRENEIRELSTARTVEYSMYVIGEEDGIRDI